jgi:hypothetical protein
VDGDAEGRGVALGRCDGLADGRGDADGLVATCAVTATGGDEVSAAALAHPARRRAKAPIVNVRSVRIGPGRYSRPTARSTGPPVSAFVRHFQIMTRPGIGVASVEGVMPTNRYE